VLPAARASRQPLELLQVSPPAQILQALEPHFDWIVVDSPPLLATADASHWGHACDGILMVVRRHRTRTADLAAAAAQVERSKWLGILFNESSIPDHGYYRQYGDPS
jgi:tyrosine-protein kinase Etk/Wzc